MYITFQYDYQKLLEDIYDNARWEAYYDPAILPILSSCCEEAGVKVVPVHETRKSGRHPNDPNKIKKKHFIETYSITKQITVKDRKTGKEKEETRRVGIPDYVIVPNESKYEHPLPSIVNVEFKMPIDLTSDYKECNPNDHVDEISHQLEYCSYIIFTDGVTWFFLSRGKNNEAFHMDKTITLYDQSKMNWKLAYREAYSDSEKELYRTLGIAFDDAEKVECAPREWYELLDEIKKVIRKASENVNKGITLTTPL